MTILTPQGPLSYPKVFRSELPQDPKPDDLKSWSASILLHKDVVSRGIALPADVAVPALTDISPDADAARFRHMVSSVMTIARENVGDTFSGKIEWMTEGKDKGRSFARYKDAKGTEKFLWLPFRNDIAAKGYPVDYSLYINPRKVDNPDKNTKQPEIIARNGKAITDTREIYPGVRARLSLSVFWYDQKGNQGVSFGLNNVQKLGDGPRIDDSKSAAEEMGALEDEAPAGMAVDDADLSGFVS